MDDAVAIRPHSGAKSRPDLEILALAEAQYGLVSRVQLLRLGLGRRAVQYRLRTGRLVAVRRGVYAVGHRPAALAARWMAAVLGVGEDAVLSHRSAAALWGLRMTARPQIDVTVPRRLHASSGIDLHRTTLAADETTRHDGIPVTTPARTLLDLAATVDQHRLRRAVEHAEMLRLTDQTSLQALTSRHARRPGTPALTNVLDAGALNPQRTRSELEERFRTFLAAQGLPRPQLNKTIHAGDTTIEADAVWPQARLIVELDGHAFHGHRQAFERDRIRDRRLQAAGWRVVRITWRQLHRDPEALAADLRLLLGTD
jgi:very-short-patch-repair endonuclease